MWKIQIILGPTSNGYYDAERDSVCKMYVTVLIGGVDNLLSNVKIPAVMTLRSVFHRIEK